MRVKVTQSILDYEGKPLLKNKTNPDGSPVLDENNRPVQEPETLCEYLVTALNNKARTETEPVGAEELAKRYQLSTKLYAGNEVDLTIAEAAMLQERVAKLYESPLIVGRIGTCWRGRRLRPPRSRSRPRRSPSRTPGCVRVFSASGDPSP